MKLAFAAVIVALAFVTEIAATAAGTSSSPTPARRSEGFGRFVPIWSPRPRRRALSPTTPAPTAVARKRDDPAPTIPSVTNLWEIVEPFPHGIETESSSASPTATGTPGSSASDSTWEDAASHGCLLVDAMRVSDYEAGQLYSPLKTSAQSSQMNYEDFIGWGWNTNEVNGRNFTDIDGGQKQPDPGWGIGKALRDLGVSDKIKSQGGKNIVIDAIHGKEPFTQGYTKDGKTYPVRMSHMDGRAPEQWPVLHCSHLGLANMPPRQLARISRLVSTLRTEVCYLVFNLVAKAHNRTVLMAVDRISTASAAKNRNPPVSDDQLPNVQTFSDIGYLNYKNILGKDPTSFKYMMSLMITNKETASIVDRALGGADLRSWPGTTFNWRSKEFKALLGTFPLRSRRLPASALS